MCGIAGIYSPEVRLELDLKAKCLGMMQALEHRGPDAQGLYQSELLVLGHQRLSIIDLSEAANQPLPNEDKTVWLTFNGEIYNFRSLREQLIRKGHRFVKSIRITGASVGQRHFRHD